MNTKTRGQRTALVTVENPAYAVQPDGSTAETWTPLDPPTMYAAIDYAAGRQEHSAPGTVATTRAAVVTMDYHPQVTTHTRLTVEGQVLAVVGVDDVHGRHVELVLACVERMP